MNIFDCKKTGLLFQSLIKEMTEEQRTAFSASVRKLHDDKQVSEQGVFETFKITEDDLLQLATVVAVSSKNKSHV